MQDRETALKEPCPHCGRTDYRWTHEFRVGLSFSPEDKLEIRCDYCRPLRMNAYYFEFAETGVEAIDRILSAVAQAGKGYHHTESWGDDGLDDMGEFHGGSYVAWIQNAANDAAKVLASPLSAPPQKPTSADVDARASRWLARTLLAKGHNEDVLPTPVDRAVRRILGASSGECLHRNLVELVRELSAPATPQEPTGASPQAETRRDCTCLGTCRGAEGLGPRWKCALETPAPVSPVEPTPANYDDPKTWASGVLNTGQSRVEPTGASPRTDVTCEHGTAMDVHCCNCHSGFIFDVNHECPAPELTWREAVEQALGVENDPENHTPSWAFDVVRAAREIGNAPTPASPQAETPIQTLCKNCMQSERFIAPDGSTICHYCGFVQPAPVSPVEPTPEPETPADPLAPRKPVVNLMDALRKSLESLDRTKKGPSEETPR